MTDTVKINAQHRQPDMELIGAAIEIHAAPGKPGYFYCTHPSLGCSRDYAGCRLDAVCAWLAEHGYHYISVAPDVPPILYGATIRDRRGKVTYRSKSHPSRDEAALECFAARPKAKRATTERLGASGQWSGFDIRSADRMYTLRDIYLAGALEFPTPALRYEASLYAIKYYRAEES